MTEPMKLRVRAKAPLKKVHQALTDPAALRVWLAEEAEVDLPGRYEFWGRYTPGGDRQRLLHADDRSLRFVWPLDGIDTTVEIGLAQDGPESTQLTLVQSDMPSFADIMAGVGSRSLLSTFWALALANLVDHVEGRPLTPKCNLTSPVMREDVLIDATPAAIYRSLLDEDAFARWFGAKVGIEPFVGGRWAMGGFEFEGEPAKIIELVPDHKMAVEFPDGQVATWELADSDGKTRLTFVQSGFAEQNPPYDSWMGWLSGIAELRRFHELADWRPIWLEVAVDGIPAGLLTIND